MSEIRNRHAWRSHARVRAFRHAYQGLGTLFSTQFHARFHAVAAFIVIVIGFALKISREEWCFIVVAISTVLTSEAFNTAIEFLTDRVSLEPHLLAGKAKDVAAGAVLLSSIGAAAIGMIIFLPKIANVIH